ncbi:MAG: 3-phosphoshikimate 1-carboxyvinyltransferase [Chloroflexi bacterium]|nr:3-phosphoshikimate 1-carboxyvinyltransferase [Chloroflexota bacterium]MDA1003073.1 3-phosphoshikimate 1-carboxyvinyltransferase [Chloroflexota bacterium]MQC27819.1 3-phosphoshikimate 1-carboxyvinyltransferase [Chloroflexota bacterium]
MTVGTAVQLRRVLPARQLRGELTVPGDKSVSHRSLLFNALARGTARIDGILESEDTRATMHCLRALGVRIDEPGEHVVVVHGAGRGALTEPDNVLDCMNSGTTMRLMAGALAGLPMLTVLTGDGSLRRRPMGRIVRPLTALGAKISARAAGTLPPIVIEGGAIRGGQRVETGVASGQVKGSILLAALAADGPVTVIEPAQTRDHTERMLGAMGAEITRDGLAVTLTPPARDLTAVDVRVPGDISTAAAWIVAATLHPDAEILLRNVGVNPTRTGLLDILAAMGARIERLEERTVGGEPVADLLIRSAQLHGVEVGGDVVPRAIDELPLVALAGALAQGPTVIRNAEELRVKESDRVAATAAVLRAFGVEIEERTDGMALHGGGRLHGGRANSVGDHRLAMLGAVAGLLSGEESEIEGADAVAVSYPDFWTDLTRLSLS